MPSKVTSFSLFAFFLVSVEHCWTQPQAPQGNVLHVEVVGMRTDKGPIFYALYSSADDFPKERQKAIRRQASSISDKRASCEFSGIVPGTYAVSQYLDINSRILNRIK
jgi:uncharacterized protein (DUF2141 family)